MASIEIENLTKRYGAMTALDNVSLKIESGEFLVLLGPSGCGKTTLLRCLAGLETPDEGEIYMDGELVFSSKFNRIVPPGKRNLGMVFQSYALWPHMTVRDNVKFGLDVLNLSESDSKDRLDQVLKDLGMSDLQNRYPSELSGGQQQRVALARLLATKPPVFLMDEPLSNLDARLRMDMRVELKKFQASTGSTTVYVTHDQVEAMTMGHRIAVLNQGSLQQLGTPMQLYRWPSNLFVAQFIGSPAMALLPVTVAPAATLLLEDRRLPVEGPMAEALPALEGQVLTAGLRPEGWRVAPSTNRNLPAEIRHVEVLGNEQLITCQLLHGGHLVTVRTEADLAVIVGEMLHLDPDPQGWRLFDAAGDAISPPEPSRHSPDEPQLPVIS